MSRHAKSDERLPSQDRHCSSSTLTYHLTTGLTAAVSQAIQILGYSMTCSHSVRMLVRLRGTCHQDLGGGGGGGGRGRGGGGGLCRGQPRANIGYKTKTKGILEPFYGIICLIADVHSSPVTSTLGICIHSRHRQYYKIVPTCIGVNLISNAKAQDKHQCGCTGWISIQAETLFLPWSSLVHV